MTNGDAAAVQAALAADAVLDLRLRVWVELGRQRMPLARVVALGEGAIVELDRGHDEPVDLFVNGRHYGTGRLLLLDGEWALRLEAVAGVEQTSTLAQ